MDVLLFVLPYAMTLGLGYTLGFLSRSSHIDRLGADVNRLKAELANTPIRTGRTTYVRAPVPSRTARTVPAVPEHLEHVRKPAYGPVASGARIETLPAGVSYVVAGEVTDDRPMSDEEYAELIRRTQQ
jgi:hypothetical protein